MKYRPEIDGLRAIAVLPVILFHAGFSLFSGGFVGVDIFFVISGFLITSIILKEMHLGKFSIIHFYERRARRIFPALFLVIFSCLPFAYFILLPDAAEDFSKSIVSASTFWSNIFFWTQAGYFDTQAELKPLLHTWSLAVEEQYYIFFPVLFLLFWRWGLNKIIGILVLTFLLSLSLAQWGAYNVPNPTFYLLPTRGWELLIGAFVAIYLYKTPIRKDNPFQQVGSIFGLAFILFAIFNFDKETPFPSLYALVPTIGTALIIIYANSGTFVYRLLSIRVIVMIGLLSYSAYLWHQPILAFARHAIDEDLTPSLMFALSMAVFPISYLSWKYVENPFRDKSKFSRSAIFKLSVIAILFTCGFGLVGTLTKGNLWRYSDDDMRIFQSRKNYGELVWFIKNQHEGKPFVENSGKKILIVGDSNSGDLINILSEIHTDESLQFSSIRVNNICGNLYIERTLFEHNIPLASQKICRDSDKLFTDKTKNLMEDADIVFIAFGWHEWEVDFVPKSIKNLVTEFGDKFIVFGTKRMIYSQQDILSESVPQRYDMRILPKPETLAINEQIENSISVPFIDPLDMFCNDKTCALFDENKDMMTFDGFHLTPAGVSYFAKRFPLKYLDKR